MDTCWAVVPAKELARAKSRLRGLLPRAERRRLILFMLGRVLQAVASSGRVAGSLVVTRDPSLSRFAVRHGAVVVRESGRGLNRALVQGCREAVRRGAGSVLILPSDLPYVSAGDVTGVISVSDPVDRGMVIVSSACGNGTNALYLKPPDLIRPAFGPGSFERHLRAGRLAGELVLRLENPAISLDLDGEGDLNRFHVGGNWAAEAKVVP